MEALDVSRITDQTVQCERPEWLFRPHGAHGRDLGVEKTTGKNCSSDHYRRLEGADTGVSGINRKQELLTGATLPWCGHIDTCLVFNSPAQTQSR